MCTSDLLNSIQNNLIFGSFDHPTLQSVLTSGDQNLIDLVHTTQSVISRILEEVVALKRSVENYRQSSRRDTEAKDSLLLRIVRLTADLKAAQQSIASFKRARETDRLAIQQLQTDHISTKREFAALTESTNQPFNEMQSEMQIFQMVNASLSSQLTHSLNIQSQMAARLNKFTFMGRYFDYFESDLKALKSGSRMTSSA